MKKKLIALVMIGYAGSSFTEGLPSPFKDNFFGAPPEEGAISSPFQSQTNEFGRPEADRSAPVSPFAPVERSPFEAPWHEAQPSGVRSSEPSFLGEDSPFQDEQPRADVTPTPWQGDTSHSFGSAAMQASHLTQAETEENSLIDGTVDNFDNEASGNWVLKRVWWQKIQDLYEQIKQVFNDIMAARMNFVAERNSLDRELDTFFSQIGLEEGQLQDTLDEVRDFLKKERTEQGFLDKSEEEFYQAVKGKERDLEQIKLDSKALQDLDQKIDEALDTLFKQIDVANKYEQKAWETFKEVAQELDDKAARASYFQTEGLLKDIQNVHSYITMEFSSYFNQVIQSAQTHARSITMQMQSLKENGVDLKKRYEMLEQKLEAKHVAKEVAAEKTLEEKALEQKEKDLVAAKESTGIVGTAKLFVLRVADAVVSFFSNAFASLQKWFSREDAVLVAREKKLGAKFLKKETHVAEKIDVELEKAQEHLDAEKKMLASTEKDIQKERPTTETPELPKTFEGLTEREAMPRSEDYMPGGFDKNPYDSIDHHPRVQSNDRLREEFSGDKREPDERVRERMASQGEEERRFQESSDGRPSEERFFRQRTVSVMPQSERPEQERRFDDEQFGREGFNSERPEEFGMPERAGFEPSITSEHVQYGQMEEPFGMNHEVAPEEGRPAEYPVSAFAR